MARNAGASAHTRAEPSAHTGDEPPDDLFTAGRIYIKHCEHPVKHHEIPPTFRIHPRGNSPRGSLSHLHGSGTRPGATFLCLWRRASPPVEIVIWCSNDYLGMGRHPLVVEAMTSSARRYGTGARGTRNIAGNSHAVVELEAEIADLHRKPAALVSSSGYVANEATLGRPGPLEMTA